MPYALTVRLPPTRRLPRIARRPRRLDPIVSQRVDDGLCAVVHGHRAQDRADEVLDYLVADAQRSSDLLCALSLCDALQDLDLVRHERP